MWPVSARWDAACRASRTMVVTAEVWSQGVPTGTTLTVTGGSIRVDEGSRVRRAGTLICSDVDLMPDTADDLLSPTTADVLLSVGHLYTEGDSETVPIGMMRVQVPAMRSLDGPLELTVADYFSVFGATRFPQAWVTSAGVRVVTEITAIVHSVLPWVEVIDLTGSQAVTQSQVWTGTLGDAVWSLTTAMAAEAVFDPLGRLILRPVPDGSAPVAWMLDTDTETACVEDASRALDLTGVYNAVYVESSDPTLASPVSAVVYQETGPLRWQPGFQRVRRFASPVLRTPEACQSAGLTILSRSLIYAQQIDPTSLPNPALEGGDTVALSIDGITATRVLSGLTIGLDATSAQMPVTTRLGLSGAATAADLSEIS